MDPLADAEKKINNTKIVINEVLLMHEMAVHCNERPEFLEYMKNMEIALVELKESL